MQPFETFVKNKHIPGTSSPAPDFSPTILQQPILLASLVCVAVNVLTRAPTRPNTLDLIVSTDIAPASANKQ